MKKLLVCSVAIAAIIWSLSLIVNVPMASAAYNPVAGDLVKTAANTAVYYIGTDNKRHLYVNTVTFWTWYTGSWANIKSGTVTKTIKIISQDDFDNLTNGSNITVRPYSTLLKFDNSSLMYTVTTDAKLALIPDTATAQSMFDTNWSTKVITIQSGFETDYTKDGILDVMAGWQTYQSDYGFQIKYPQNWKIVNEINAKNLNRPTAVLLSVSFGNGTYGNGYDGELFVSVYDKRTADTETPIKDTGKQFSDRQEKRENITINGISAVKVTITTPSIPSWIYEVVKIEQGNYSYLISNGAIKTDLFNSFYGSFKLN